MKSLLAVVPLLLLLAVPAPPAARAQSLFPAPAGADSATPGASPLPGSVQTSGSAAPHDATVTHDAATVPLPGSVQPGGAELEKTPPPGGEGALGATGGGGKPRMHKADKAKPAASPGVPATFQTEQDLLVRVRIRQAETRVQNDPAMQAEWAAAHQTRTDPKRREALTAYYEDLYGRMLKLEPALAKQINARKLSTIERMRYTRLGESDAEASPTPEDESSLGYSDTIQ